MRDSEVRSPGEPRPSDPSGREVAQAYLAYFDSTPRNGDLLWAYDFVTELAEDRPDDALEVISALVALCDTDLQLAIVAAGPIEDLLCHHGPSVLARVQEMAAQNASFRRCLRAVWGANRMDPHVRSAIDIIVKDVPPF